MCEYLDTLSTEEYKFYFEINSLSSNQTKQMVQLSLFHLSTPHTSNQLHNVGSSRWSNDKQIHTGHPTLFGVEPR